MTKQVALLIALTISAGAMAQVTGLVSIPVADTKGVREVELGYLLTGNERNIDKGYTHFGYAILGIHERVEVAASTDFIGNSVWGFKCKLLDGCKGEYAVSAGLQNIRAGQSDPFVVGRYNCCGMRLHAGWSRTDTSRFICGADYPIMQGLTLGVDHWSGKEGSTWGGLFYAVPSVPGLTANLWVQFPSEKANGIHHTVGLVYGFRF